MVGSEHREVSAKSRTALLQAVLGKHGGTWGTAQDWSLAGSSGSTSGPVALPYSGTSFPRMCGCCCLVAKSCLTLRDLMDCSPPDSWVHGDSPGKNIGVGCHFLFQGIFLTQGSNPCLLHRQVDPSLMSLQGSPKIPPLGLRNPTQHLSRGIMLQGGQSCPSKGEFPSRGGCHPKPGLHRSPYTSHSKRRVTFPPDLPFHPPPPPAGPFSIKFSASLGDALPSQLLGGPLMAIAMAAPGPRAAPGEAVSSPLISYMGPHSH